MGVCAVLFAFKYFNFVNENVAALAAAIDWNYPIGALEIVLPIGLSFHTFQSLSYVVEVYRGNQKAEKHFGIYSLYVMYFPQLVAGPIERPQNLLHQFHTRRHFSISSAADGLMLALWGLFKKVVVADSASQYVDAAYNHIDNHNGCTLLIATYLFAVQIYCDFSGYSDIARGISRVFGIELMKNFDTPYFSRSITEFWARWHISLSQWFRDYIYIPMGGNRVPFKRITFNLMAVFLISGLWHGANWTFLLWGGLHGLYVTAERLLSRFRRKPEGVEVTSGVGGVLLRCLLVFNLVAVAWIPFRAPNTQEVWNIAKKICSEFGPPLQSGLPSILVIVLAFFAMDLTGHMTRFWERLPQYSQRWRLVVALALIFGIVLFGVEGDTQFIYFQF